MAKQGEPAGRAGTAEGLGRHPADRLRRELGTLDATMLVVSSVIGVGIFLTPGTVAALVPDGRLFLLAWLVGGALSAAGALANAELGTMMPRAGGDYVYLREAFHPLAGFLVGWLSFFVIYAGTVATLAVGFADGLEPFVALSATGRTAIAVAAILATSWVNHRGLRAGALFNTATALLKVGTLAALVAAGFAFATEAGVPVAPPGRATAAVGPLAAALALPPILFSYLGWNASIYVASELRDPGRTLPRSLLLGLAACTLLYLAVNALYLGALGMDRLAGEPRVGEAAARALFGEAGGRVAAALVLLSVLGCLNATILVGPRIAYAMALDGLFFAGTDRVHEANLTPHVAIAVQAAVAIALVVLLRRFPSVLDYTTFAIVLATIADVAALAVLRRERPAWPRPFRAIGYPWVPGLYLVANVGIALAMAIGRPLECAAALAVAATGLPAYVVFARRASR
ncbi:amino acid permease [bacterium]|nr:amino acid permease [bacterium]